LFGEALKNEMGGVFTKTRFSKKVQNHNIEKVEEGGFLGLSVSK